MNSDPSGSGSPVRERPESPGSVSGVVDWLVAAALVVVGAAAVLVGVAVRRVADRAFVADLVADGVIESDALAPADLVDVTVALGDWGGIGLVVTGGVLAVAGVAFAVVRYRARRGAAAGEGPSSFGTNAVYGGVTTVVLSFVPASPVLGGAVAAYLQADPGRSGAKIGAASGALAAVPLVAFLGFVFVGLADGLAAIGESGSGLFLGGVGVFVLTLLVVFNAGLGAVGGIVGERFVD